LPNGLDSRSPLSWGQVYPCGNDGSRIIAKPLFRHNTRIGVFFPANNPPSPP
jgi:hypothetical protein